MKIKTHFKISLLCLLVLCLFGFFGLFTVKSAYADTIQLSGTITDNTGTPISGVQVTTIESGQIFTSTDSNGFYSLPTPSGETSLILVNSAPGSGAAVVSSMPNNWTMRINNLD